MFQNEVRWSEHMRMNVLSVNDDKHTNVNDLQLAGNGGKYIDDKTILTWCQ